jgi:exopolyphosphatase/guanosine-5'-triphosphate,3'-diphosphate pyrophosphatase
MESFRVGSIAWSSRYFFDGQLTRKSFEIAEIAAKAVLDEAIDAYQPANWDIAYGSAGTVGAVSDALLAAGWPSGAITQEGLDWLLDKLISAQSLDRLKLAGIREDRKAVIGGGLSITRALFSLLRIEKLHPTSGGLRHGLLCELRGSTDGNSDLRVKTVNRLATKFGADRTHGARVGRVATNLLSQMANKPLDDANEDWMRSLRKLTWAAELHEIGSHISHSDYHKHGAYVLDNADAMGFSLAEMHRLSLLVLGHRGKLRKLEAELANDYFRTQLIALRLAVILCHARRDPDLSGLHLHHVSQGPQGLAHLRVQCGKGWAHDYPQSAYLMREEASAWQKTPWPMEFSES